jgi:hypothetical protein
MKKFPRSSKNAEERANEPKVRVRKKSHYWLFNWALFDVSNSRRQQQ